LGKYIIILFTVVMLASCDLLEVSDMDEYPVKVNPYTMAELTELNDHYHQLNGGRICSTLNEFGFTGYSRVLFPNDENPCLQREISRIEILDSDSLLDVAKQTLLENQEFTMVTDTSLLELEEVFPLYGCTICEGPETDNKIIEWKFRFSSQKFGNIPVENTEITVFVDALGVNRIWGNWYQEVKSYGLINIGYMQAQESVKGWQFDMNEITGEDYIFTVTETSMTEQPEFRFLPHLNRDTLELRKSWLVPIMYDKELIEGWHAYVDAYEGTLLRFETIGLQDNL
tara:strand:+ start:242926 stop:243780 length:855 start_codon:yes stop_codon:yes gene_type:complete